MYVYILARKNGLGRLPDIIINQSEFNLCGGVAKIIHTQHGMHAHRLPGVVHCSIEAIKLLVSASFLNFTPNIILVDPALPVTCTKSASVRLTAKVGVTLH